MTTEHLLQSDEQEVLAANRAFYDALRSLDLAQMEAVWLHEDWVKCLHPGWELLVGWEEIQKAWADIFRSSVRMLVTVGRPLVHVSGDTAWVSCLEDVTSAYEGGLSSALVEVTNIFVRRQGRWLMVHRTTSTLPGDVPAAGSRSVQ